MNDIYLYNTLSRKKEKFIPIEKGKAGMYCCGPTVYNYAHIGNLRAYFFEDILKRILLYNGLQVKHVMNITDVGHLVSDADEGEDKMEKGARREGKTVWQIAEYFADEFMIDIKLLNILPPTLWCKATEHIEEQIKLIKCLEEKGFTYVTSDGVYYDTSKFRNYGELGRIDIEGLEEGKRISFSEEKKNKTDFSLWKFSPANQKRQMEWDSPWGKGFPGWHLECSAMSMKYLGDNFDIHCGGVDHIPVHHTNEIAQSEACTGKKFVNYWLHCEFLLEDKGKMSKSAGEFLKLKSLLDHGYSPLDFRYFLMMTHYRKKIMFSFDALDSARNGYRNLREKISEIKSKVTEKDIINDENIRLFGRKFTESINDDLNITEAVAVLWETIKDTNLNASEKLNLLTDFDKVLGLEFDIIPAGDVESEIPDEIKLLAEKRKTAKSEKNYVRADELRRLINEKGYEIMDTKTGYEIKKIRNSI